MSKVYLFDLDGTLVDSMQQWAGKMLRILNEYHMEYPDDIIRTITPLGDSGTAKLFIQMGIPLSEPDLRAKMDAYAIEEYTHRIPLKAGVESYLKQCKAEGGKLYVLTASPHKMTDVCLKRNGVYDLFDRVWTVDDFGMTKAQPEIYHAAAKEIGCTPGEIVFFDDNIVALTTAKTAGLQTVGVYDPSAEQDQDKVKATAHQYLRSFTEWAK